MEPEEAGKKLRSLMDRRDDRERKLVSTIESVEYFRGKLEQTEERQFEWEQDLQDIEREFAQVQLVLLKGQGFANGVGANEPTSPLGNKLAPSRGMSLLVRKASTLPQYRDPHPRRGHQDRLRPRSHSPSGGNPVPIQALDA